jgi:hypothetical protein
MQLGAFQHITVVRSVQQKEMKDECNEKLKEQKKMKRFG